MAPLCWDLSESRSDAQSRRPAGRRPRGSTAPRAVAPYAPLIYKTTANKIKTLMCPSAAAIPRASNIIIGGPAVWHDASTGANWANGWYDDYYLGGGDLYGFLGITNYLGVAGLGSAGSDQPPHSGPSTPASSMSGRRRR